MNFADLRFYKKNGYLVKKNLINKNIYHFLYFVYFIFLFLLYLHYG